MVYIIKLYNITMPVNGILGIIVETNYYDECMPDIIIVSK